MLGVFGRRWDFYILYWDSGSMDFDGVKPPKGQDRGRSSFSCPHDRDRGNMKKSVTFRLLYSFKRSIVPFLPFLMLCYLLMPKLLLLYPPS
jgi:hypothetical protein